MSKSNTPELKGRIACETHDCIPTERSATTGRVTQVVWIPKYPSAQPKFQSWTSVYSVFTSIAFAVLELPEGVDPREANLIISDLIDTLYAQHEGEDAWDIAYTKWVEPSDDDEEVVSK